MEDEGISVNKKKEIRVLISGESRGETIPCKHSKRSQHRKKWMSLRGQRTRNMNSRHYRLKGNTSAQRRSQEIEHTASRKHILMVFNGEKEREI